MVEIALNGSPQAPAARKDGSNCGDAKPSIGWSTLRNVNELHIELTAVCNLACSYCYAEVLRPERGFPLFSLERYRRTIELVASHSQKPHVGIIFHGGEPLLQSADWYDQACAIAREIFAAHEKTCDFGLQSNLVLLREAHLDVFIRHQVKIGTSLDGPKELHDRERGRWDSTVKNMRRLMEAQIFSGAIAVIHHHNWEHIPALYSTFLELGVKSFHMNVASAVGHGSGAIPLTEDQIFRSLVDDFDCLVRYDGAIVETRLLDKIRRHVRQPSAGQFLAELKCDNPFCHAGINMVVVKHTGEIYPCGCAGSSGNIKKFLLGNVDDEEAAPEAWRGQLRRFHAKTDKYESMCRTCPARHICEHGCPAFDMNDPITPEHHCGATRRLREYIDSYSPSVLRRIAEFEVASSAMVTS